MTDDGDDCAASVDVAVRRLREDDRSLRVVTLAWRECNDEDVSELADCLVAHPNIVRIVNFDRNQLTDETGVKLARFVAASSNLVSLTVTRNMLGQATLLAMADALRVNTSLQSLYLVGNLAADWTLVRDAFVDALRYNPVRPADSQWLVVPQRIDFDTLQRLANERGHVTLQSLLVWQLGFKD